MPIVAAALLLSRSAEPRAEDDPAARETTAPTAPAEPGLVDQFSGSGNETTGAFAAAPNWEIRWQSAAGKPFAVELLTKDGRSRGSIVEAGDRMEGTTFVVEGGEFKLKVSAAGDWSIQVFSRGEDT